MHNRRFLVPSVALALSLLAAATARAATSTAPAALIPRLTVIKYVALLSDPDDNGMPSRGDILRYSVVVTSSGTATVNAAAVSDAPDANTTFLAGSVNTDTGSVITGNTAGDTSVVVQLGDLAPGSVALVTFDVLVPPNLSFGVTSIANQALVTSDNVASTPSDDPSTVAASDATVTTLAAPPQAIPTASSTGLALLVTLLAAAGALSLARRR